MNRSEGLFIPKVAPLPGRRFGMRTRYARRTNGVRPDLWRAIDHEGEVLESIVTKRQDKTAASPRRPRSEMSQEFAATAWCR